MAKCKSQESPRWNFLSNKEYHKCIPEYAHRHYIYSGYLCLEHIPSVFESCWLTLLSVHNETLNIYTHLIPCIALLMLCPMDNAPVGGVYTEMATDLFAMSCAAGFFLSCWYHIGCCRCPSHWDHYFYLDLLGIFTVITTCTLYGTFIGYSCHPLLQTFYCSIDILCLLGFVPMVVMFPASASFETKKWSLFGFVSFQMVPLFHWFYLQIVEDRLDVLLLFWKTPAMFFGFYLLGFVVWHYRFPECLAPGYFDIYGHSHQFWHICTAIPPFVWWFGMNDLLDYLDKTGC